MTDKKQVAKIRSDGFGGFWVFDQSGEMVTHSPVSREIALAAVEWLERNGAEIDNPLAETNAAYRRGVFAERKAWQKATGVSHAGEFVK